MQEISKLPPGYIDFGFVAIHVAKVAPYTADIHRFMKYLSVALALSKTEAGTPEAFAVLDGMKANQLDDLQKTLEELGNLMTEGAA